MSGFVDSNDERFGIDENAEIAENAENPENTYISRKEFKQFIQTAAADTNNYLVCDKIGEVFSDSYEIIAEHVGSVIRRMIAEANIYRREHILDEDARSYLDEVQFGMGSLDLDVRNLCRMLSDRGERQTEQTPCEPVAICDALREYVQRVNMHMPERNVFNVRFVNNTKKPAFVRIPMREFTLIMTNFVVNAMKHSHTADKRIDIILNCINHYDKVAMSVLDYGVGVDLEVMNSRLNANIESFIKNNSIGRRGGNGLIACGKLAREVNGEILVLNYPDAGAVFTLLLNRVKEYPFNRYVSLRDSGLETRYVDDGLIYTALRAAQK